MGIPGSPADRNTPLPHQQGLLQTLTHNCSEHLPPTRSLNSDVSFELVTLDIIITFHSSFYLLDNGELFALKNPVTFSLSIWQPAQKLHRITIFFILSLGLFSSFPLHCTARAFIILLRTFPLKKYRRQFPFLSLL